jgi:2-dehydro-3-deoxygluconokinase
VTIAIIGEGMLELRRDPATKDGWQLGYGGDTLNTAIHLARAGLDVSYISALGSDAVSDDLRQSWQAEGVDVSCVLSDPERFPGLYAISTDEHGERTFSYWRGESAARRLFEVEGIAAVIEKTAKAELLYFSLISLAVLPESGRAAVFDLCERVRANGGRVAFDSNYRPRLWSEVSAAQTALREAAARADIGLPTLGDEELLFGNTDAAGVAAHWHGLGTGEVVVKQGADGCLVSHEGSQQLVPALRDVKVVDTSGAGDAFNAGYLGARLRGEAPEDAARAGHELAAWVVSRPGAIPAEDA